MSESPHVWPMDGRSHGCETGIQSFQRKLCETVPPWRMVVMPICCSVSTPSRDTGRPAKLPHAPGTSCEKPMCALPGAARPTTNSPAQRMQMWPGFGPMRPQSTVASLPGAIEPHAAGAAGDSVKGTCGRRVQRGARAREAVSARDDERGRQRRARRGRVRRRCRRGGGDGGGGGGGGGGRGGGGGGGFAPAATRARPQRRWRPSRARSWRRGCAGPRRASRPAAPARARSPRRAAPGWRGPRCRCRGSTSPRRRRRS